MNTEHNKQKIDSVGFNREVWANARPHDISRRKLARMLGTSDSNLISIEKGASLPSILLAFKYCAAVNINPNRLMTT